jgi:hypothetical protein
MELLPDEEKKPDRRKGQPYDIACANKQEYQLPPNTADSWFCVALLSITHQYNKAKPRGGSNTSPPLIDSSTHTPKEVN